MASQKYILTEIKKGYNLSWYVCSQCYYTGTSYQSLAQGHVDFTGNELYLSVEIPQSTEIRQSITANSVTDAHAVKVGQVYGFCIEESTDEDYNDFYIDVVGWAKKG